MSKLGIGIGGDYGDPESGSLYMPMKQRLNQLFEQQCAKSYCPVVDEFSIVLRVSGRILDFDSEGIERMRRNRKKRYITLDIVIPEKRWKMVPKKKVRNDLAELVREALKLEVARLKKDKEEVNEADFWHDVAAVFRQFLSEKVPVESDEQRKRLQGLPMSE